jgi:hypothetical protein
MSKNNQINASGGEKKKKQSNMLNFFAASAASKKTKVLEKSEDPVEVKTTP